MTILTQVGQPFEDQCPGTAGLRRPTAIFRQPGYLESYLQTLFEVDSPSPGGVLIVGGDGRFFCREAAGITARIALANGYRTVLIGREGLMSTPAASHLIRHRKAHGAVILSASHNPGGPDGDFGVKYNTQGGGPASPALSEAITERAKSQTGWRIVEDDRLDLDRLGEQPLGEGRVVVIDPVIDHLELLAEQFDFDAIRSLLARPNFRMVFDAMNAVTGPYAVRLFEDRLGAPQGTVLRRDPQIDFGGQHPDPHPDHLQALFADLFGTDAADFGAASDGDGDRNMILGPGVMVSPGDSLAVMVANAAMIPAFRDRGLSGAARSMPTSRAVDRVARRLGLPLYETPTGWKYFTNLLDTGRIGLCGEESFGTGSDHVREKDGLWAVLFWLNLIAVRGMSVPELLADHWATYGRDLYRRHDYEGLDEQTASAIMGTLRQAVDAGPGRDLAAGRILSAEDFTYVDPVDGSVASNQGLRFMLQPDARITYRLSGTGTRGATLRVYLERYVAPGALGHDDADLSGLARTAADLAQLGAHLGPDHLPVVT